MFVFWWHRPVVSDDQGRPWGERNRLVVGLESQVLKAKQRVSGVDLVDHESFEWGTSGVGGWRIFDNKRPGYNEPYALLADNSDAETETGASRNKIDQLSNGFKLRFQYNDTNGAGGSYIYMAFGQSLVGSNNIPCTAF